MYYFIFNKFLDSEVKEQEEEEGEEEEVSLGLMDEVEGEKEEEKSTTTTPSSLIFTTPDIPISYFTTSFMVFKFS